MLGTVAHLPELALGAGPQPLFDKSRRSRPKLLDLLLLLNLTPGAGPMAMANIAMLMALPALPPLSAAQQTTISLARSIEQQQRDLIAQRSASLVESHEDLTEKPVSRGLKRANVPAPLRISPHQAARLRPSIQLAPIRLRWQHARVQRPPRGMGLRVRYPASLPTALYWPYPMVPFYPYPTAAVVSMQQQQQAPPRQGPVTDVFYNARARAAPVLAQPPLAQERLFDFHREEMEEDDPLAQAIGSDEEPEPVPSVQTKGRIVFDACGTRGVHTVEFDFDVLENDGARRADTDKWARVCLRAWDEWWNTPSTNE